MFAKSREKKNFLLLLFISIQTYAMESNPVKIMHTETQCNARGECNHDATLISKDIIEICDSSKSVLSWNEKRPGAYLLTCDCECSSHDNNGWIIDTSNPSKKTTILKTTLGKTSTLFELERGPSLIYDTLANHPLCEVRPRHPNGQKIFVSLFKIPTGDDEAPYCFYPAYVIDTKNTLSINTDPTSENYSDAHVHESSVETQRTIYEVIKILESDSERQE